MRPSSSLAVALLLLIPVVSGARPPVLQIDPSAVEHCPGAEDVAERWAARQPPGAEAAAVQLIVQADADRLIGLVRIEGPGLPAAARRLGAARHACQPLVDALLTAAALLAETIDVPPAPPPPEPPEPEPEPEPAPVAPERIVDGYGWWAGVGARGDIGATPGPLGAGELTVAWRDAGWSAGAAMHIGGMTSTTVGEAAAIIERYATVVRGCLEPAVDLCLVGRAGAIRIRPDGAADGETVIEVGTAVGVRLGWRPWATDAWALGVDAEALMPLRRLRFNLDTAQAWTAWPVSVGLGLTVEIRP